MDKALIVEQGAERLVSAESVRGQYHGTIPRHIHFICPFCRQPLHACAMESKKRVPHFKHAKNNEIAHECEKYARNETFSNVYHRMPMPIYLEKSSSSDSEFVMKLGIKQLDLESISELESEGAHLEIGRKHYNVTLDSFGHGSRKLEVDTPRLNMSCLVKLSHCRSNLFMTWNRPEDSRTAMIFSADLDVSCGKRINYCDGIAYGSQLLLAVPTLGEADLENAIANAKRLGIVKSSPGSSRLAVYSAVAPKADYPDEKMQSYLKRCGYSLVKENKTPAVIWPPSLESSNEFEPIFDARRIIFASKASGVTAHPYLYLHSPRDTEGNAERKPFIRVENGTGSFAVVKTSQLMRFASYEDGSAAAAILYPAGNAADKILDASAFHVDYDIAESGLLTICVPWPCRIRIFNNKKKLVSTLDLSPQETKQMQLERRGSFIVERKLRGSSGFLPILRYEAIPSSGAPAKAQSVEKRLSFLQMRYPIGKRTALSRQEASKSFRRKSAAIAHIRKGGR